MYPHLLSQWDFGKNSVSPHKILPGARIDAWWKCPQGHSWTSSLANRTYSENNCPYCSGQRVLPGFNDMATTHPHVLAEWDFEKNTVQPTDITAGSSQYVWWKCPKGHSHRTMVSDKTRTDTRRIKCPHCAHHISVGEKELHEFLRSILSGEAILTNTRAVISPYELDMYIPEKKIAVEYNGVYWHSEKMKSVHYHSEKYKACCDKDIQLITVWEDDWQNKRPIVEEMLKSKLGVDDRPRVYARNTTVVDVPSGVANDFFERYHIQGAARCTHYYGLSYGGGIVAVMGIGKMKDVVHIDRYATSCLVVGGMGKLVKKAVVWGRDNGCSCLVAFSDNDVSDGHSYATLGFRKDKELPPDYKYVYGAKRCHKSGFRLKRFRDDPNLEWCEGLTERELAELNNIPRIWDAGKIRWVLTVPQLAQEGMAQ